MQEYAHGATEQGATGLERLARMGASGEHAGNLFRDIKKMFGWPSGCAPVAWIQIPTVKRPSTPHPVMWPREFFERLFQDRHDLFQKRLIGASGSCNHFWEGMKDTEFMQRHPCLPPEIWPNTVPLGSHADGGGFNKHDSLFGLSWNSLVTASE